MTWQPPEPDLFFTENFGLGDISNVWGYSEAQLLAVRQRTIEECARLCDDEAWRLKEIAVSNRSPATNNKAIQASNLADAIRKLGAET